MSFNKNTQFNRMRKPAKRVLVGETPQEEAARLAREIAAHPVTKCEPGEIRPAAAACRLARGRDGCPTSPQEIVMAGLVLTIHVSAWRG